MSTRKFDPDRSYSPLLLCYMLHWRPGSRSGCRRESLKSPGTQEHTLFLVHREVARHARVLVQKHGVDGIGTRMLTGKRWKSEIGVKTSYETCELKITDLKYTKSVTKRSHSLYYWIRKIRELNRVPFVCRMINGECHSSLIWGIISGMKLWR